MQTELCWEFRSHHLFSLVLVFIYLFSFLIGQCREDRKQSERKSGGRVRERSTSRDSNDTLNIYLQLVN